LAAITTRAASALGSTGGGIELGCVIGSTLTDFDGKVAREILA
jgi:hypothetical protein